ncbi:leucine-rich repeat protein [Maribacter sp. Asnod1-A12]|uniref:leucine-rich repeat protein n=1 Tax=Maribacter sp. Asnod1-A12 TaxID=3160576 RepID=UPI0038632E2E
MKKLTLLFFLFCAAISLAQNFTDVNGIEYQVTSTTAPLTVQVYNYTGANSVSVNIPATVIDNGNSYSVTAIGNNAFIFKGLTSVTIPNSVTTIGNDAFGYNQLTSVTIPNSVTTIGNYAFYENRLTSISIPNSVTSIGNFAFGYNQLTSVTIPNSVTTIGNGAFENNQLTSISIPNSVTSIGDRAFFNNKLTAVVIPNNVTVINFLAFARNELTSVTIPNSVTTIGNSAFGVNKLTSITIPNSVTFIDSNAFYENEFTSFTIPNNVTIISNSTFTFNPLTNVNIHNGITSIGELAFQDTQLTSVTIPSSVTAIGGEVFYNTPLNEITSLSKTPAILPADAFEGNNSSDRRPDIDLIIPFGSEAAYVNAGWTGFKSITTLATINNVTSSIADNIYGIGTIIPIQITFDEAVTVTGIPQLTLETGATDQVVDYTSGSGTTTLSFDYTIQGGNISADLDYVSATALALNGGTIKNGDGNAAFLNLPEPGEANTLGTNKALVIDGVAPLITLTGDAPQTIEQGAGYSELGATTNDGSIVTIDASAFVDAVGNYSITYNATDASGNNATEVIRTVNVVDTAAPLITLIGADPQTIEQGAGYSELGATANDGSTITIDVTAFVDEVGNYSITYNATDASGNAATEVVRTVNVVDTTAPVITLTGDNPQIIELAAGYSELGATTNDGSTVTIDASAFVDEVGNYSITYNATDASGNDATEVIRTVNVVDTTAPIITLTGDNPQTIELGAGYIELGATANDGSTVTIDTSAFVDEIGNYSITYNATDAVGNAATEITRTVNVVDTTAPIITLTGDNPQTIELGAGYTELGATANDGSTVTIDATTFVDAVGSYSITYNATSASGNNAIEVIRTVIVVDNTVQAQNNAINVPKGFSPNGDGINDTWVIANLDAYPGHIVHLYNRVGSEVFTAENYSNNWGGISNGKQVFGGSDKLPAGPYYYVIETGSQNEAAKTGWIYINY